MAKTEIESSRSARSLSATLASAFLTLSVVVVLVSGGLLLLLNIQTQQQAVATRQQLIAQDAARTVSSFVQEKFGVLTTTVRLTDPATSSSEELTQVLDRLLGLQPAFRQLILLDTQDQQAALASRISSAASGRLVERLEAGALSQVRQGQQYISPVYFDEVTSEPLMIMAVPAVGLLGDFQGTLLAEVNLKFMWDLVDQLEVGDTGLAYVVDKSGTLIAFQDTARVLRGENELSLKQVSAFASDAPSSATTLFNLSTGIEGTTVIGAYVPLGTPNWAVVTELPWQEAYRDVIRATIASIGAIVAIALLASLVGIAVSRQLVVPLVNLTATAGRIAGGELALQATTRGPREITRLAAAFNSMSSSLQKMINKETSSRLALEATVDSYLGFVEQVTRGDLTQRLDLSSYEDEQAKAEPLYVLGTNLNTMVSSLAEMTDRNAQLLAETRRAKEIAEEANRVKSLFLASMSHELRTPLNAILNFTKLLRRGILGPVNERQVDTLNEVVDSGQHLLSLINDVLDVSKIQSGALALFVEEDIALQDILSAGASTLESLIKDKPVTLVKDIDADLPPILCDQRRVQQILLNLLSNAAKFTDEGIITLRVQRQDDHILFAIIDTGVGIPRNEQGRIFEPFFQTEKGIIHAGGTGLGLPISKSLVEAHGGKIWLESTPDNGSAFMFTLPIESPHLRELMRAGVEPTHG